MEGCRSGRHESEKAMSSKTLTPEEAWLSNCNFVVRYEVEVCADTPERAATIARDRLLDADSAVMESCF